MKSNTLVVALSWCSIQSTIQIYSWVHFLRNFSNKNNKRYFTRMTSWTLDKVVIWWSGRSSSPWFLTDRHSAIFKMLKPVIPSCLTPTVPTICFLSNLNYNLKVLLSLEQNFTLTRCSSCSFISQTRRPLKLDTFDIKYISSVRIKRTILYIII